MTARTSISPTQDEHRQVWELLPWYVNHTLDEAERSLVERHLKSCLICRQELQQLRQTGRQVRNGTPTPEDIERSLQAIQGRIATQRGARPRPWRALASHLGQAWDVLRGGHPAMAGLVALQAVLLVALGLTLVFSTTIDPQSGTYETLTSAAERSNPAAHWQIVFDDAMPMGRVQTLLHGLEARIVDGPSTGGMYTLALGEEIDAATASQYLEQLHQTPGVLFVTGGVGDGGGIAP
ncbi:MAG: anti-sigma factor family protein [Candidatus Competibacterales bacterium]